MELQDWRLVAASAIGTSHVRTNAPCQDAFCCNLVSSASDDVVVLIASDGAGSASQSLCGAELATQELMDNVQTYLAEDGAVTDITRENALGWLENAAARIAHRAATDELPVREYACTLLAAIVSSTQACFIQVGDGAMVIRPRGDDWAYVFWPQHGEYINTTVFLTDPESLKNFEFSCRADSVDEVAAFTDGIEALVLHYANREVHAPFFDGVFKAVRALPEGGLDAGLSEQLAQYLGSSVICDKTDDDKTLLLASRVKQLPAPEPVVMSPEE